MLNSETKRHIDAARDVLVGVAPNPTTQIDQITYALIYKFMDDMDQASVKVGGEASFFVGDLEKYAWSNLMSSRLGNQEKMDLYSDALSKFSLAKQLPELFRTIFKAATLPYRSPETLGLFLKEISYFDYSHPEELGNAYEYLLSIMSSQGDAGQFRTPRHVIDFIVDVINPTKDDIVLDPACGTGGFLVSTYNHILEQHDGKNDPKKKEKILTPDERKKLMSNLQGYDIDPTMVRIAQVNMYLHQFKNPQIFQYDSLTSEERWNDKYDVILANPPFMSPKGGIKPHNKFGVSSNRAEVLFVDYIINHLKPKGRAGVIVPEGVIFQSGSAYKALRKNLVENGLYAVVSLPGGVFQPYSGVKTTILFFDNQLSKRKAEIAFIKISADGFDLGASKRVVAENDLPNAVNLLRSWVDGENISSPLVSIVAKDEIAANPEFNLSGDRYKKGTVLLNSEWERVSLKEAITLNFGERITKKNDAGDKYPVYGGGGESFRTNNYNREDELIIARFAMGPNCVRQVSGQFWLMDSGASYSINKNYQHKLLKNFVDHMLLNNQEEIYKCARGGAQKNLHLEMFYEVEVPVPPLEVQEQIGCELDEYAAIISGAKRVVDNWKPKIEIDPDWELVPLGEICDVRDGTHDSPVYQSSGFPLITSKNLINGKIDFTSVNFIAESDHLSISKRSKVDDGDILMAMIGTIGNAVLVKKDREFSIKNVALFKLQESKRLLNSFLFYLLQSSYIEQHLFSQQKGVTQKFLALGDLRKFKIPLPPLELQTSIVKEIDVEKGHIESAEQLVELYKNRVRATMERILSGSKEVM